MTCGWLSITRPRAELTFRLMKNLLSIAVFLHRQRCPRTTGAMGRLLGIGLLLAIVYLPVVAGAAEGGTDGASTKATAAAPAAADWFKTERASNLVAVVAFSGIVLSMLILARRGRQVYIRPIAGLNAIEDAVGRAAEMGRPVAYVPGLTDVSDPATAASMAILSRVGCRSARLRTRVLVPNYSPLTFPVARSVLKASYIRAGRKETFNPDDVAYFTSRHMTYTMAVVGMMTREKIAASFLIGHFFSESLILAETGAALGAKQIGGCDSVTQLPFFITTCDYTLIGEELFAAGAVMSDDLSSRAAIAAHDYVKAAVILLIIGAVLLSIADMVGIAGAREVLLNAASLIKEAK